MRLELEAAVFLVELQVACISLRPEVQKVEPVYILRVVLQQKHQVVRLEGDHLQVHEGLAHRRIHVAAGGRLNWPLQPLAEFEHEIDGAEVPPRVVAQPKGQEFRSDELAPVFQQLARISPDHQHAVRLLRDLLISLYGLAQSIPVYFLLDHF